MMRIAATGQRYRLAFTLMRQKRVIHSRTSLKSATPKTFLLCIHYISLHHLGTFLYWNSLWRILPSKAELFASAPSTVWGALNFFMIRYHFMPLYALLCLLAEVYMLQCYLWISFTLECVDDAADTVIYDTLHNSTMGWLLAWWDIRQNYWISVHAGSAMRLPASGLRLQAIVLKATTAQQRVSVNADDFDTLRFLCRGAPAPCRDTMRNTSPARRLVPAFSSDALLIYANCFSLLRYCAYYIPYALYGRRAAKTIQA